MKNKKQLESKRKFLSELLKNEEFQEEIIMGSRQRAMIRTKINLLTWVLEDVKGGNQDGNKTKENR